MSQKSLIHVLKEFATEEQCIKHLEHLRWPAGIVCPLCGSTRQFYIITRDHKYKCADCEKTFSVRKGTIFEESRLPLRTWFAASWLVTHNRKGISSCQLAREIGVTQKTAWFMIGRLREVADAMGRTGGPLNGEVEADETYLGGKEKNKHRNKRLHAGRGTVGKHIIFGALERGGKIKTQVVTNTDKSQVQKFVVDNIQPGATIYTDTHGGYYGLTGYNHRSVNHSSGEYVRGRVHTNSIESFWALLKRGYHGTFHHFSPKHSLRYSNEFATRMNYRECDPVDVIAITVKNSSGKSLPYKKLVRE